MTDSAQPLVTTGAATVDHDNPWPGLEAFREADAAFFFGREQARDELTRLILQHRLVVLHGRSGLGKTSLLQAGVFPKLREAGVLPVHLRLDFRTPDIAVAEAGIDLRRQVKTAIDRAAAAASIDAPPLDPTATLWEWFYRADAHFWNERSRRVRPVLVFDQFEEAFTHGRSPGHADSTERFLGELVDLVRGSVPAGVAERFRKNSDEALAFKAGRDVCGVLLAMRQEFLSDLLRLKAQLPSVFDAHFELTGMTLADAERVVTMPASHLIESGVAPRIVSFVASARRSAVDQTTDDATVDPAILSVFCRELNRTRHEHGLPRITADLVAGTQAGIIADFCYRSVADLGPDVQSFIESELITESGYRDSIAYEQALRTPGVTADAIATLIDRRLVRPDGVGPRRRLELTHDVLIDPLVASRNIHRVQERERKERQTAEQTLRAAREAAEQERRERELQTTREKEQLARELATQREREARNTRRSLVVALVLFAVAATLALSFQRARNAANRERQMAESNLSSAHLQQALGLIGTGRRAEGLAYAARALRVDPANNTARSLAFDAMLHADWPLPEAIARHDARVTSAQFSQDGTRLVTASDDRTARVWNTNDGSARGQPIQHDSRVLLARFARGGRSLVTVDENGDARLWDLTTAREEEQYVHPGAKVTWASVSPAGDRIATGADDGTLAIWSGAKPRMLKAHTAALTAAQFSRAGDRLVTSSRDKTSAVWDMATGRQLARLTGHQDAIVSAQFSPDGQTIATASRDGTAGLWEARTGRRLFPFVRHNSAVLAVQFSPNGTRLLTASEDASARLWDTGTGLAVGAPLLHDAPVTSVAFSADGFRVLTASRDGTARLWSAIDGRAIAEPIRHAAPLALALFSPDGQHAATASDDGTVQLSDIRTGSAVAPLFSALCSPRGIRFGMGAREVAVDCDDGGATVWDGSTAKRVFSAAPMDRYGTFGVSGNGELLFAMTDPEIHILRRWSGGEVVARLKRDPAVSTVTSVSFSPDARMVVTLEGDTVRTWDVTTSQALATIQPGGSITAVDFSPDSSRIITIAGATAQIWEARTGMRIGESLDHGAPIVTASVTADASRVLTAADRTVKLWSVPGTLSATLPHPDSVVQTRLSRDGASAVTLTTDRTLRLWDAGSGRPVAILTRDAQIQAAEFSADSRRIVTGSADGTVRLWEPKTGDPQSLALLHGGEVDLVRFAADAQRVIGMSHDGVVRVWDVPLGSANDGRIMAPLVEAVAGYAVNQQGAAVPIENRVQALRDERSRQRSTANLADRVAVWVLGNRQTRTVSPFSMVAVDAYVERQLASPDGSVRADAQRQFAWHPRVRASGAQTR